MLVENSSLIGDEARKRALCERNAAWPSISRLYP